MRQASDWAIPVNSTEIYALIRKPPGANASIKASAEPAWQISGFWRNMAKNYEGKAFTGVKKNPFKDPIRPREKTNGLSEWSFKAPSYDQRTSCSIPGGDSYGAGFTNPIGTTKVTPITAGPIPQQSRCFSPDEVV